MDPRQNKEAGIVDDQVQIALPLIDRPADGLIAGLDLPGAGPEAQGCDDLALGAYEVAQLRPGHEGMPEVVVAFDIGVPQPRFGSAEDRINGERSEIDGRDDGGFANRLFDVRIGPVGDGLGVARRGQCDQPIGVHAVEGHATAHIFQSAIVPAPSEPLTDFPG